MSQVDFKLITDAILTLDAYRIDRYVDPRWIDAAAEKGALGPSFKKDWPRVQDDLYKLADTSKRIPIVLKFSKLKYLMTFARRIAIVAALVGIILYLAPMYGWLSFPSSELGPLFIAVVIVWVGGDIAERALSYKIAVELQRYNVEHRDLRDPRKSRIKTTVQHLINIRRTAPREIGEMRSQFLLYNVDYTGIQVIKQPSRFRRTYVVVPVARGDSGNKLPK